MADDTKIETALQGVMKTRRAFVKTAAQVAITAPAVGLLLSASTKSASAEPVYKSTTSGPGDDEVINDDGFPFFDDGGTPGDDFVP